MEDERSAACWQRLVEELRPHAAGGILVAFSAGLDSSVLLDAALEAAGRERVVAFTAVSPSLAARERDEARRIAGELGARHHEEETHELDDPDYVANAGNRCYFCKRELFSVIAQAKERLGAAAVAYGYHRDDDADVRPGLTAARQAGALRPLWEAGLGKRELRALARLRGRSFAEKPSGACLSSRIPMGTQVTAPRLAAVEAVEERLRSRGYAQIRARLVKDDAVRLETDARDVARLAEEIAAAADAELASVARAHGIREITVDPRGYRRPGEP